MLLDLPPLTSASSTGTRMLLVAGRPSSEDLRTIRGEIAPSLPPGASLIGCGVVLHFENSCGHRQIYQHQELRLPATTGTKSQKLLQQNSKHYSCVNSTQAHLNTSEVSATWCPRRCLYCHQTRQLTAAVCVGLPEPGLSACWYADWICFPQRCARS